MGEVYSWYEQEEVEKDGIDTDLSALWKKVEAVVAYPQNPTMVRSKLQKHATAKQQEVEGNKSVTEKNNAIRGNLTIEQHNTNTYHYALNSYWVSTKFKFVPVAKSWSPEAGRLVVFLWAGDKEFFWLEVNSLDDSDVQDFLWWVNSINKLIALNADYKKLDEEIPSLLWNKHNSANYAKYYDTYQTIMKKTFVAPVVSTTFPAWETLKRMFWFSSTITTYTQERWEEIKKEKKKILDPLFAAKWFPKK